MTPLTPSLPIQPSLVTGEQATLGRQVPPPAHMGFRAAPMTPITPPARRSVPDEEAEAIPPPIHRNLKPQRKGVPSNQPADVQTAREPTRKTRGLGRSVKASGCSCDLVQFHTSCHASGSWSSQTFLSPSLHLFWSSSFPV